MTSATPSDALPASAERRSRPATAVDRQSGADRTARGITLLLALATGLLGVVALASPDTLRDLLDTEGSDALVHLAGALLLAVGVMLLLARWWHDILLGALVSTAAGGVLASLLYATSEEPDAGALALFAAPAALAIVAFALRYRAQGFLVGDVGPGTTNPVLAPYVRQKTVLLTTYKRDGTPVGTPVSIMVDGDRAYIRSFEKACKTRRIRNNPVVEVAPCTAKGRPTGSGFRAVARRLDGTDNDRAFQLIGRKQPFMQGFLVPFGHKAANRKTGATIQFEIAPIRD